MQQLRCNLIRRSATGNLSPAAATNGSHRLEPARLETAARAHAVNGNLIQIREHSFQFRTELSQVARIRRHHRVANVNYMRLCADSLGNRFKCLFQIRPAQRISIVKPTVHFCRCGFAARLPVRLLPIGLHVCRNQIDFIRRRQHRNQIGNKICLLLPCVFVHRSGSVGHDQQFQRIAAGQQLPRVGNGHSTR